MPRYVVTTGHPPRPYTEYVSRTGFFCSGDSPRVNVYKTPGEAFADRDHFAKTYPARWFNVEQLPPRLTTSRAVLYSWIVQPPQK